MLKVGRDTEKRALLILDALFKALVARGHDLRFGERYAGSRRYALEAVIRGREVEFWLVERLEQTAHVETAEEKARRATYGSSWAPKVDQTPSGNFILEAASPWDARLRHRWRDSEQQRLEGRLGDIVLGLETIAAAWVEHDRHIQEREAAQAREERRQQVSAARAAHPDRLAQDLVAMADAADEAEKVRRFLARVEAKMPEDERSDAFSAWFKWATGHAEQLDPLSRPDRIAKRMVPDLWEAD